MAEPAPHGGSLSQWLRWLEGLNPQRIELGLERVRRVHVAMGAPAPARRVISVGGTNGKGSTVALIEACARHAGWRVGAYTSPHILRYQERIRIDGLEIDETRLLAAFEAVEQARAGVPLTYFEFGTLAALACFAAADLDLAILEVGLGGRLDAVNLIDADVSVLTSVDLDHQAWLGDTVEAIGWEKAHIFRTSRPAVIGPSAPPTSVLAVAQGCGAQLLRRGVDFDLRRHQSGLQFSDARGRCVDLPLPALDAPCQPDNAATAVAALFALAPDFPEQSLREGVASATVAGRLQRWPAPIETWLDVGHNPEAARVLATWLATQPPRRNLAVFAALGDKDVAGVVDALHGCFERWCLADLRADSPRAVAPEQLAAHLPPASYSLHPSVPAALQAAWARAGAEGRVLVFGSFLTVAAVLRLAARA